MTPIIVLVLALAGWHVDLIALPCPLPPEKMSCVPGGWFLRGRDVDDHKCDQAGRPRTSSPDTVPQARIWISTFFMDRFEVTNADYQECVRKKACRKSGPRYGDFRAPKQPITGVSWFDAVDYCRFRGKRLPTEAEWEKAARGSEGDTHPWGNAPSDCERAVIRDRKGRSCGQKKRVGDNPGTGRVMEVGSRPAGRYSLHDLMGNAEEWVADWYSSSYAECGADCLGRDPKGPCQGQLACHGRRFRVVRGGSWYWPADHATGYHRRPHYPDNAPNRFHHFGFRCAADAPGVLRSEEPN